MTSRAGSRVVPRPGSLSGTELLLAVVLLAFAALAWLLTHSLATPGMRLGILTGARPMAPSGFEWTRFGFFLLTWLVMMTAMMLPGITPFTIGMSRLLRVHRAGTGSVPALVVGYLLAWLLTGVGAYACLRAFDALDVVGSATAARSGAAVLVVAGLFQFTPLKQWCLVHCRSPMALLMRHGQRAVRSRRGALLVGCGHGGYCIGCCWALMVVLLAAGMMSLVWMAGVAAVITVEKVLPHGRQSSYAIGALLLGAGLVLLVLPELVGVVA
ncbi:Predicted metal-binding membrane protein [Actinopolyspora xinjiangensis]|uniref:Predicted metal-binding membrane protein n=1 Tax=Actinopolyspora xinjiangensis TaxID=405564 RepID=A0A1H0V7J1_9ACTN|nr:Predicted metal-binding membrane protein [Actinopolyspora xinjiangensis]